MFLNHLLKTMMDTAERIGSEKSLALKIVVLIAKKKGSTPISNGAKSLPRPSVPLPVYLKY